MQILDNSWEVFNLGFETNWKHARHIHFLSSLVLKSALSLLGLTDSNSLCLNGFTFSMVCFPDSIMLQYSGINGNVKTHRSSKNVSLIHNPQTSV